MKGLVVSDSTTMRRILQNALLAAGCEEVVVHADGGVAAATIDPSIAVIVIDWGIPGHNGLDLMRVLRSRDDCAQVQALMVTSRNARVDVERALEAGVNGYLLKPFTADALRLEIDALLQTQLAAESQPVAEADLDSAEETRAA